MHIDVTQQEISNINFTLQLLNILFIDLLMITLNIRRYILLRVKYSIISKFSSPSLKKNFIKNKKFQLN